MISVSIFYADQTQCDEWDAELLAAHPTLVNTTEEWRTEIGWYWQAEDGQDGGPFDTEEECKADAVETLNRPTPEEFAAGLDSLIDEDAVKEGRRPVSSIRRH